MAADLRAIKLRDGVELINSHLELGVSVSHIQDLLVRFFGLLERLLVHVG